MLGEVAVRLGEVPRRPLDVGHPVELRADGAGPPPPPACGSRRRWCRLRCRRRAGGGAVAAGSSPAPCRLSTSSSSPHPRAPRQAGRDRELRRAAGLTWPRNDRRCNAGSIWTSCGLVELVQVHRRWTACSNLPATANTSDRHDDDDERGAEGARQVQQVVGVGELDAEALAPDQALADDGGDDGRAGGDAEPAGDVGNGRRQRRRSGTASLGRAEGVDDVQRSRVRGAGPSGCRRRPGRTPCTAARSRTVVGW